MHLERNSKLELKRNELVRKIRFNYQRSYKKHLPSISVEKEASEFVKTIYTFLCAQ